MQQASLRPENIHLDSANIQSSNAFFLDISLREKRSERNVSALISFGQWHHIYKSWVCVFTEAIPVKRVAQGQRRAAPRGNWTTDPAGLLVTSLPLSTDFYRRWINTSRVRESRSMIQMLLSLQAHYFTLYKSAASGSQRAERKVFLPAVAQNWSWLAQQWQFVRCQRPISRIICSYNGWLVLFFRTFCHLR